MNLKLMNVTPELAAKWLTTLNTANPRKLRKSIVGKYAKDMIEGRWGMDPNPICFGSDGILLNGQHRLLAVVESDTTQVFVIATDCPAHTVCDIGKTRSTGDIMQSHGVPNSNNVGATVAAFLASELGTKSGKKHDLSSQRIHETYETMPDLFQAAAVMPYVYSRGGCSAAYVLILRAGFDKSEVRQFALMIASGEGYKGDPTYMLHHKLKDKERKFPSQVTALVVECWNRVQSRKKWSKVILPGSGEAIAEVVKPVILKVSGGHSK